MNIKILETKLQTIFENDLFAVTEEIFINQDLYDLLKKDMPSISKLLDKLILENSNSSLDNFLNWFDNESNYIKIANLANVDAYQYINKLCYEYCEILKSYQKLKLVKNETGGVNDERTGSN